MLRSTWLRGSNLTDSVQQAFTVNGRPRGIGRAEVSSEWLVVSKKSGPTDTIFLVLFRVRSKMVTPRKVGALLLVSGSVLISVWRWLIPALMGG